MSQYTFTKTPVSIDRLSQEIQQSTITIALENITILGAQVDIYFKTDLSSQEQTTLSGIVTNHSGQPLPQNQAIPVSGSVSISSVIDTAPFAVPTYRTKYNATSTWEEVPVNSSAVNDFYLTTERYIAGGQLLVKNAQEGDYITAEVRDIDGVIPEAYRSALCESHPTVATYLEKWWISPGSEYSVVEIDTSPLNAKITAGLYLRVTYYSVNAGSARKIAMNYKLTKKL